MARKRRTARSPFSSQPRDRPPGAGFVAHMVSQLALCVLGIFPVAVVDKDSTVISLLAFWCLLGTGYSGVMLFRLGQQSRLSPAPGTDGPTAIELSPVVRLITMLATTLASAIGITAAAQVLLAPSAADEDLKIFSEVVGVWAMVLSWALMHWGFAQIYYQRHYGRTGPLLRVPGTKTPRMVDFVYFAFTMGTTFAASDCEVLDSRGRWLVTWHSVISFFFNGFIIVLALNTISGK